MTRCGRSSAPCGPTINPATLTFANGVSLTHLFSLDRAESLEGADAYQTGGGTALYDALSEGPCSWGCARDDGRPSR